MELEEARGHEGETLVEKFLDKPPQEARLVRVSDNCLYVTYVGTTEVVSVHPRWFELKPGSDDKARNAEALAMALSFASAALEWAREEDQYILFETWVRDQGEIAPPTPELLAMADMIMTTMSAQLFAMATTIDGQRPRLLADSCTDCLHGRHDPCTGRRYSLGGPCACAEDSHLTLLMIPAAAGEIPEHLRDPS